MSKAVTGVGEVVVLRMLITAFIHNPKIVQMNAGWVGNVKDIPQSGTHPVDLLVVILFH
jgi:hypothetical protein